MNFYKLTDFLKLDNKEFDFQFKSHPSYPSALAFSDTLSFLGVKNDVYELEKEFWDELPVEFLCITNEKFSLIKKEKDKYKVFSDDERTFSKTELHSKSKDIVILFKKENIENHGVKKFNYDFFLYLITGFILLYLIFTQTWNYILFNLASIVGIYISLELFKEKFGKESLVLNNICGTGISAKNNTTSCSKIIDSDKINLLGLKISDFSLIYFISILLIGLLLPMTGFVLKTFAIMSLLIIFYSTYIQIFVEKAICKICVIIIIILITQLIISSFQFNFYFTVSVFSLSIICLIIVFSIVVYINNALIEKEVLNKSNLKNLRFKRNYDIFKQELFQNGKITFKNDRLGFFLGNRDAKIHISLLSNPYCGFCKEAHNILEKILKKYPETISAQIRFNHLPGKADAKDNQLMMLLFNCYLDSQNQFLKTLDFWFETKDMKMIEDKFPKYSNDADLSFFSEIAEDNFSNNLTFTPVFLINGYQISDKYERNDIFYFLDELLEDDEIG